MLSKLPFRKSLVVFVVALCAACVVAERMRVQVSEAAIKSHQTRWDCLARESKKVPSCVAYAAVGPIDVDYCDKAVATCKALGLYAEAYQADERLIMWDWLAGLLRLVVFIIAVGGLLGFGIGHLIRRALGSEKTQ